MVPTCVALGVGNLPLFLSSSRKLVTFLLPPSQGWFPGKQIKKLRKAFKNYSEIYHFILFHLQFKFKNSPLKKKKVSTKVRHIFNQAQRMQELWGQVSSKMHFRVHLVKYSPEKAQGLDSPALSCLWIFAQAVLSGVPFTSMSAWWRFAASRTPLPRSFLEPSPSQNYAFSQTLHMAFALHCWLLCIRVLLVVELCSWFIKGVGCLRW